MNSFNKNRDCGSRLGRPGTKRACRQNRHHEVSGECPLLIADIANPRLRVCLTQSGNRLLSALKGFPPHWLIPKVVPMQNEISFYSDELGRKISCIYSAFGGLLTVTTPDGRQKISQLGSSNSPVTQARMTLIEMEREKKANLRP